ncbi:hypothetical protein [Solimonas marina]|uniref:Uncharacterized protein n=1 Tax=Solimonas marina TaxID=2714601 RepID=A0A970B8J0_9GAMM|nr:hypothetical protein [Solimonas marina]NKF24800.1 hypothetical protein [Solimonas marina]
MDRKAMLSLSVEIRRFTDPHQPGFVECGFVDARGKEHVFIEKVPVVTSRNLSAESIYPQSGHIACKELGQWHNEQGQHMYRITTELPFGIESIEGLSVFEVQAVQLEVQRDEPASGGSAH